MDTKSILYRCFNAINHSKRWRHACRFYRDPLQAQIIFNTSYEALSTFIRTNFDRRPKKLILNLTVFKYM